MPQYVILLLLAGFAFGCNSPQAQQLEPEITPADELEWAVKEKQESGQELKLTRMFGSEAAQQMVKTATSVEYFHLNSNGGLIASAKDSVIAGAGLGGLINSTQVYNWDADLSKPFVPDLKCRYQDEVHIVDIYLDCTSKVVEIHSNGQMTGRGQLNVAVGTKFGFFVERLREHYFPDLAKNQDQGNRFPLKGLPFEP